MSAPLEIRVDWLGEIVDACSNGPLWSLRRIMDAFNFADFYDIGQKVIAIATTVSLPDSYSKNHPYHRDNSGFMVEKLLELKNHCESVGLAFSVKQIGQLIDRLQYDPKDSMVGIMRYDLRSKVVTIQEGIKHELEMHQFYKLRPDLVPYYTSPKPFGDDVDAAFPSTSADAEEAGKCLAVGRHTACVFHLMRVMEIGVRSLGKSLGDPTLDPSKNPNWGTILARCDAELQKSKGKRSPVWQTMDTFFSESTANLRAVKDAWRNPTMHVERTYDEEKAKDVFNSVRSFMRHLATKLVE